MDVSPSDIGRNRVQKNQIRQVKTVIKILVASGLHSDQM